MGDADVDSRVEIFQLGEGGLCSGYFSNMFRSAVEVPADVLHSDGVGIINGDLFWPSEDEILGDFDSQL
jgi:hypothetical protein